MGAFCGTGGVGTSVELAALGFLKVLNPANELGVQKVAGDGAVALGSGAGLSCALEGGTTAAGVTAGFLL